MQLQRYNFFLILPNMNYLRLAIGCGNGSDEYGVGGAAVDVSVLYVGFILVGRGVGCIMSCWKASWGWIGGVTEVLRW